MYNENEFNCTYVKIWLNKPARHPKLSSLQRYILSRSTASIMSFQEVELQQSLNVLVVSTTLCLFPLHS